MSRKYVRTLQMYHEFHYTLHLAASCAAAEANTLFVRGQKSMCCMPVYKIADAGMPQYGSRRSGSKNLSLARTPLA